MLQREVHVLIIGDSHVRRMEEFRTELTRKLAYRGASVRLMFKGGAHLNFIEDNLEQLRGFDVVVVMAGGNDLSSGASEGYFEALYSRIYRGALRVGVRAVVFTSIWPRQDSRFNSKARSISRRMERKYEDHPYVVFWQWDRRQTFRTYDGVHLPVNGYRRAILYLTSPIMWTITHRL
jgi:lysophospholipase L1-like esterase